MFKKPHFKWLLVSIFVLTGAFWVTGKYIQKKILNSQIKLFVEKQLSSAVFSPVTIQKINVTLTGNIVFKAVAFSKSFEKIQTAVTIPEVIVHLNLINWIFRKQPIQQCIEKIFFMNPQISATWVEKKSNDNRRLISDQISNKTNKNFITSLSSRLIQKSLKQFSKPSSIIQAAQHTTNNQLALFQNIEIIGGILKVYYDRHYFHLANNDSFIAPLNGHQLLYVLNFKPTATITSQSSLIISGHIHLNRQETKGQIALTNWPIQNLAPLFQSWGHVNFYKGSIATRAPFSIERENNRFIEKFNAKLFLKNIAMRVGKTNVVISHGSGCVNVSPQLFRIESPLVFETGKSIWKLSGIIPMDHQPLSLQLQSSNVELPAVIPKLKNLNLQGQGSALININGSWHHPQMTASVGFKQLQVGHLSIEAIKAIIQYKDDLCHVESVQGTFYHGAITGSGVINLKHQNSTPIEANLAIQNTNIHPLIKIFSTYHPIYGMTNAHLSISGTFQHPCVFFKNKWIIFKNASQKKINYVVDTTLEFANQYAESSINIPNFLIAHGIFKLSKNEWRLQRFLCHFPHSSNKIFAQGELPWNSKGKLKFKIQGEHISFQKIPFMRDQFKTVQGNIDFKIQMKGTFKNPRVRINIDAPDIFLDKNFNEPLMARMNWTPYNLIFKKFNFGNVLKVSGTLGLQKKSANNIKIQSTKFPISLLTEIVGLESLPKSFHGFLSGQIYLEGTSGNPVIVGNGSIQKFQFKSWHANKIQANISLQKNIVKIIQFDAIQNQGVMHIHGNLNLNSKKWDIHLTSKKFEVLNFPRISGKFICSSLFKHHWWNTLEGSVASKHFEIYIKNKQYDFNQLKSALKIKNKSMQWHFSLGSQISGFLAFMKKSQVSGKIWINSVPWSQMPILSLICPRNLKIAGIFSGQFEIKPSTWNNLRILGNCFILDGWIQQYKFDRIVLNLDGNFKKINANLLLDQGMAHYKLTGTIQSPVNFWNSNNQITLNGPIQNLKFKDFLRLLQLNSVIKNHKISGRVNGNVMVTGSLQHPILSFKILGSQLQWDQLWIPQMMLGITFQKNSLWFNQGVVHLSKGKIVIQNGLFHFVNSHLLNVKLGCVLKNISVSILNINKHFFIDGLLELNPAFQKPIFAGKISVVVSKASKHQKPKTFVLNVALQKNQLDLKKVNNKKVQLIGSIDFHSNNAIEFKKIQLINSPSIFEINGNLSFNGMNHLSSNAKNVDIKQIGNWIFKKFPLSGEANYRLLLSGTLTHPILDTSFLVTGGKIQNLPFDIFSGYLRSKSNILYVGDKLSPIEIDEFKNYALKIYGTIPFALSKIGLKKIRNQKMNLLFNMPHGNLKLLLLTNVVKQALGPANFFMHVSGPLDDPIVNANFSVNHGMIVPAMMAKSITNINGRIYVVNNKVVIHDLNGTIGSGVVFISTPNLSNTRMHLENFIPKYYDLQIRTVTKRGLLLSVPTIMKKNNWGTIKLYGLTPATPLLVIGPSEKPRVVGTIYLQSGHYTYPPLTVLNANGHQITYKQLSDVNFMITIKAGSNAWYSNEFNTNYLELKVNPGSEIFLKGRDADSTALKRGIQCSGAANSYNGYLEYLGHTFQVQEAHLFIPLGAMPILSGQATDMIHNVDIVTQAGVQQTNVTVWVHFHGSIGKVVFNLSSNPRFAPINDEGKNKQLLLSYLLFGRDMTGYTEQDLKETYQQNVSGAIGDAVLQALDRIASNAISRTANNLTQGLGGINVNVQSQLLQRTIPGSTNPTTAVPIIPEANGLTTPAMTSLINVQLSKYIDPNLAIVTDIGVAKGYNNNNTLVTSLFGLNYNITKHLYFDGRAGTNAQGQEEENIGFEFSAPIPNFKSRNPHDKTRPQIVSFDVYPLGLGEIEVHWITDKITVGTVRVYNTSGLLIKLLRDDKNYQYNHTVDIQNLPSNEEYKVQLDISDLNKNKVVSPFKKVLLPAL